MPKPTTAGSTRKPPEPAESHAPVAEWMRGLMPDLQPIVARLDELLREAHEDLAYAVKWKKAYYGLPEVGWAVEVVAYDVSVNVVLLGGADFTTPPPLGDRGRGRYVKVRSVEEVETTEMREWIEEAGRVPGWQ